MFTNGSISKSDINIFVADAAIPNTKSHNASTATAVYSGAFPLSTIGVDHEIAPGRKIATAIQLIIVIKTNILFLSPALAMRGGN